MALTYVDGLGRNLRIPTGARATNWDHDNKLKRCSAGGEWLPYESFSIRNKKQDPATLNSDCREHVKELRKAAPSYGQQLSFPREPLTLEVITRRLLAAAAFRRGTEDYPGVEDPMDIVIRTDLRNQEGAFPVEYTLDGEPRTVRSDNIARAMFGEMTLALLQSLVAPHLPDDEVIGRYKSPGGIPGVVLRHTCGYVRHMQIYDIQGGRGCGACATSGYNPNLPGYLYITGEVSMHLPDLSGYGFGITNYRDEREKHYINTCAGLRFEQVLMHHDGAIAPFVEGLAKRWVIKDPTRPSGLKHEFLSTELVSDLRALAASYGMQPC